MNHFNVSVVKSVVRIFGFGFLMDSHFALAGGLLILAEILGIVEEMV